jgi:hypothetical protein
VSFSDFPALLYVDFAAPMSLCMSSRISSSFPTSVAKCEAGVALCASALVDMFLLHLFINFLNFPPCCSSSKVPAVVVMCCSLCYVFFALLVQLLMLGRSGLLHSKFQ